MLRYKDLTFLASLGLRMSIRNFCTCWIKLKRRKTILALTELNKTKHNETKSIIQDDNIDIDTLNFIQIKAARTNTDLHIFPLQYMKHHCNLTNMLVIWFHLDMFNKAKKIIPQISHPWFLDKQCQNYLNTDHNTIDNVSAEWHSHIPAHQ